MPRIYAVNESHDMEWGFVDFINGVAPMAAGADTSYFSAEGYDVDLRKNALTPIDKMTRADVEAMCDYFGVAYTSESSKYDMILALETSFSTKYITALTVASTAGATEGTSDIAVTGAIGGTNVLKYKAAAVAPSAFYKDVVDETWTEFESGDDIDGLTAGQYITVVEVNAADEVLSIGNDEIVVNTGE